MNLCLVTSLSVLNSVILCSSFFLMFPGICCIYFPIGIIIIIIIIINNTLEYHPGLTHQTPSQAPGCKWPPHPGVLGW